MSHSPSSSKKPTFSAQEPPFKSKEYVDMAIFQSWLKDAILVAIDLEGIDHRSGRYAEGLETHEKVSEVGVSYIDNRKNHFTYDRDSSTEQLSSISKGIVSQHIIINRWRNFTEETCDASHHKRLGVPHTAMPYHCMVAESQFRTHDEAISDLDRLLKDLSTKNLTEEEIQADQHRVVIVLYWDARMEVQWFHDMGYEVGRWGALQWDFQKFKAFRSKFGQAKTAAGKVFASLGVRATNPGNMGVLHNATNDTFAQLVALLRCMVITEEEWRMWSGPYGGSLDAVDLSWIGDEILKTNQKLRPILPPGEKPQDVEDPEEEEEPETVVVHESAMAEIEWGIASTSVRNANTSKPSTWADALRKPAEEVEEVNTPWSSGWTWDYSTWTSSSGGEKSTKTWSSAADSLGWRSTKTWSTAGDCAEPVKEKDHVELPSAQTSNSQPTSTESERSSSQSTTKAEGSEWTVVGNRKPKPQAKKSVRWASKEISPVDNMHRQSNKGPRRRDNRSFKVNNDMPHTKACHKPKDNLPTAPAMQQANHKPSSVENTMPSGKPKPLPKPSAAPLHWAKLHATDGRPVR
ncbi:hypothetical protein SMACR_08403 [Sordaria macrospora]|uniref:WGS project CABT00000000 data, contig 2.57 n=2 Tax=Sordaria macrospora TaxID=5147 RepID=F7WA24_SORMK|nr:uncharacterized protein SMAC_08403 [Sordaria macrospora k-hell]KAA8624063.1 hypothetical protein SMACR_08403 [Sordaria macrospora]KAH7625476.1 hypothetical protein B0T09DRAFT_315543 [Sordaria sp. MPI-SDFR-AT-0083]WPJ62553.1 hypothetical protein SMAC4_08403 [Sordaria macrospora]CCC14092.1 unnamed protein product [Sordaria macrospora k-hell]